MRRSPTFFALGLALAFSAPLSAQGGALQIARALKAAKGKSMLAAPADARKGFWIGGGLGAGMGSLHCGICENERDRGTSGYLRAGFTLNRKLLLGAELGGWQRSGEEGRRRILSLTAGGWWYPAEQHGYFLRWGAGLSRWRASQENEAVVSNAIALIAGVGYEVWVNPGLSAAVYLNGLGSSSGSLWLETKDDVSFERHKLPTGGHAVLFQLGVGLTRH